MSKQTRAKSFSWRAKIVAMAALGAALAANPAVRAATSGPPPTITVTLESDRERPTWSFTPASSAVVPLGEGRGWRVAPEELPSGLAIFGGRSLIEIRRLEFDHNPFIELLVVATNNEATTQSYVFSATLGANLAAPNVIAGSISSSVADGGSDGAVLAAPAGEAIYEARIDGTPVATMQDDPFALVALPGGNADQADAFGPAAHPLPVTTSIGLVLRPELSAGDTATITARFGVQAEADLEIVKEGEVVGNQIVYTLTVTNHGPSDASDVEVIDDLPPEITYLADDCGGTDLPPWTWSLPSLASGASETCTITTEVVPPFAGHISNTATVSGDVFDPQPGNDSDSLRLTYTPSDIPTLGELSLLLLGLVLAAAAALRLRGGTG